MRQIIESRNSYQSVVEERQVPLRTALEAGASAWKGRALSFSKECSSLGLQTTLPDTGERYNQEGRGGTGRGKEGSRTEFEGWETPFGREVAGWVGWGGAGGVFRSVFL